MVIIGMSQSLQFHLGIVSQYRKTSDMILSVNVNFHNLKYDCGQICAMKRLAVLVKNEKVDAVVASLKELDIDAIIYDVKSAGKEKEKTRSRVGTSSINLAYVPRKIIATVVDSDKVQSVSEAIKKSIGGESKGVIIVTSVDDFIPF